MTFNSAFNLETARSISLYLRSNWSIFSRALLRSLRLILQRLLVLSDLVLQFRGGLFQRLQFSVRLADEVIHSGTVVVQDLQLIAVIFSLMV